MAIVHHTAGVGEHLVRRELVFLFKRFKTLAILVKMYTLRTGSDWNGLTVAELERAEKELPVSEVPKMGVSSFFRLSLRPICD